MTKNPKGRLYRRDQTDRTGNGGRYRPCDHVLASEDRARYGQDRLPGHADSAQSIAEHGFAP